MTNPPGKLQFRLLSLFVGVTIVAVVVAVLVRIEPFRQAPLVSVVGSAVLVVGVCLALIRAIQNLVGKPRRDP